MGKLCLLAVCVVFAEPAGAQKNPVTVDAGGTGDYPTIAEAIASFCSGGVNVPTTPPYIINVVPGVYDEAITLNDADVGQGDIQGDLTIRSSVPGMRPVVKVRKHPTLADGIEIFTNIHNVTFNELLFCPSLTNPIGAGDALIRVGQNSTDAVYDTLSFSDCLFTQIDASGNPLVTSRTAAYTAGMVTSSPVGITYFLLFDPQAGEPKNLGLDHCTFYGAYASGSPGTLVGSHLRTHGTTAGDTVTINNCCFAYSGNSSVVHSGAAAAIINYTGTDQTLGPDYCNYFVNQWERENHNIIVSAAATTLNISNSILRIIGPNLGGTAGQVSRNISGNADQCSLTDVIIENQATGAIGCVVNGINAGEPEAWTRVTIHSAASTPKFYGAPGGAETLTVRDCVFSGAGPVWAGSAGTGGTIDVDYCAYVEAGPDAVAARGTIQTDGANNVGGPSSDPSYRSYDGLAEDYLDVQNSSYGGKGAAGSDLSGGADYDPLISVEEWNWY